MKNPSSPFDKLRANGEGDKIVAVFPFVLSLSKHGCAVWHPLKEIYQQLLTALLLHGARLKWYLRILIHDDSIYHIKCAAGSLPACEVCSLVAWMKSNAIQGKAFRTPGFHGACPEPFGVAQDKLHRRIASGLRYCSSVRKTVDDQTEGLGYKFLVPWQNHLEKALANLQAAEVCYRKNLPDPAVSRACYGVFHAAIAALIRLTEYRT